MSVPARAKEIEVPPLRLSRMAITLVGQTMLVVNRFDEKAIQMILDKQTGKPKAGKEAKDPADVFRRSLYPLPGTKVVLHTEEMNSDDWSGVWAEGRFGFPAIAFKAAAVRAATDVELKMTEMRRAFHINETLVEIQGDPPKLRMDMVRVGMGVADVRFRAQFDHWRVRLPIVYNAALMNPAKIVNLFNSAGFGVGVGEWRPEKDGMWGMFGVAPEIEQEVSK